MYLYLRLANRMKLFFKNLKSKQSLKYVSIRRKEKREKNILNGKLLVCVSSAIIKLVVRFPRKKERTSLKKIKIGQKCKFLVLYHTHKSQLTSKLLLDKISEKEFQKSKGKNNNI